MASSADAVFVLPVRNILAGSASLRVTDTGPSSLSSSFGAFQDALASGISGFLLEQVPVGSSEDSPAGGTVIGATTRASSAGIVTGVAGEFTIDCFFEVSVGAFANAGVVEEDGVVLASVVAFAVRVGVGHALSIVQDETRVAAGTLVAATSGTGQALGFGVTPAVLALGGLGVAVGVGVDGLARRHAFAGLGVQERLGRETSRAIRIRSSIARDASLVAHIAGASLGVSVVSVSRAVDKTPGVSALQRELAVGAFTSFNARLS